MRVLVTGAAGMLGTDVVPAFREAGHDVTGLRRADLDVTDPAAVGDAVAGHDLVVNAAAWTAVDDAESHEAEAFAVNASGASLVARAAARGGARLIHVSTDYVFGGVPGEVGGGPGGAPVRQPGEDLPACPWPEDAPLRPLGAYGRTKAAGEWAVRAECADTLVVRTAWLYGAHGSCFPTTIARLAAERDALSVVDDQHGQPTWSVDVADVLVRLVAAEAPPGTYHATASGRTTWFEFAGEVVTAAGRDAGMVTPTTTAELPRPAPRPTWSVLSHARLEDVGVTPIPDWRDRWSEAAPHVLP